MLKRWLLLAALAMLLGALLEHEDAFEDARAPNVKAAPGGNAPGAVASNPALGGDLDLGSPTAH
ncbi:MAG TPA: hypothetical protein VK786_07630 [bacterium]|jgi:hypothetical protein|nr:hypothetical protein [bacterium]